MSQNPVILRNNDLSNSVSAIVNEYGAKNLLKIVRYVANGYNFNGVIITYNDDGSITCVGRSTGAVSLQISDNIYLDQNKQYIMSGTTTGSSSTYFLQYSNNRDSAISVKTGDTVFTPYNYTTYPNQTAYIQIASGVDINTTFYPMIRDANIKDNTFVPYSMTNRELTERIIIVDLPIDAVTLVAGETANLNISSVVPSGYSPTSVSYIGDNNYSLCYSMFTQFLYDSWFLLFQNTTNSSVTLKGHAKISMMKY